MTTIEKTVLSKTVLMDKVMKDSPLPPQEGQLVEGKVIGHDKLRLYIDVKPFGTALIYGREYLNARDVIKNIHDGDSVTAKVVEPETEEGYIGLSLKEARQAATWSDAEEAIKNKTIFELLVKDANKGGLIIDWQNVSGFLPASQLKEEHYPRVTDGNKDRIMEELKKLIGKKIAVTIIGATPKEDKLIFSEKTVGEKDRTELVEKYKVGDVLDGEVTGAVDFGIFVKVESGLEGLVHISELDWSLVENPRKLFNVGDKVKAKVIEIKDGKVSLSIKALKDNPWKSAEAKYKKGMKVSGVPIKYNKHGVLVSIEEGVAGLVHISNYGTEDKMKQALELGKNYDFVMNLFEPKEQKMTLVPADIAEKKAAEAATAPATEEKK
ncbi:MAG: RNA binding S1 domain protein [Parcubacteria group bacterium GW2011_GWF2_38_76]|nr:MAG: RNA binding S1 domain protein [Parcubacteria group bacterium GW2011_GWF2_38_76]HBM45620.1 30S ribosomal protein S1 [Patescibacteria group bacterium]